MRNPFSRRRRTGKRRKSGSFKIPANAHTKLPSDDDFLEFHVHSEDESQSRVDSTYSASTTSCTLQNGPASTYVLKMGEVMEQVPGVAEHLQRCIQKR